MGMFLERNSVSTVSLGMLDSSGKGGTDAVNKEGTVGVFTSPHSFARPFLPTTFSTASPVLEGKPLY